MKFHRLSLLQFLFLLVTIATLPVPAFAWSGGPFKVGPGSQKNYDGTYKASIVGKNLLGVLSVNSAAKEGLGKAIVFVNGTVYNCDAILAIEPASNKVAGSFRGPGGKGALSLRSGSSEAYSSDGFLVFPPGTTSLTMSNSTMNYSANSTLSTNGTLSGAFMGSIKSKGGYSLVFSGRGSASFDVTNSSATVTRFITIPIRVNGSRTSLPIPDPNSSSGNGSGGGVPPSLTP